MKTLLIVVSWLQAGPVVAIHELESIQACRLAAEVVVSSIKAQALTNLTGPHRDLKAGEDATPSTWTLSTAMGREVARIRCAVPST